MSRYNIRHVVANATHQHPIIHRCRTYLAAVGKCSESLDRKLYVEYAGRQVYNNFAQYRAQRIANAQRCLVGQ